jgi:hypothetical protein
MANRGRPPKPIEQKRLLGNPGKRPLPKQKDIVLLEPIKTTPKPPRKLFDPGLELWNRVWESGIAWISPTTDVDLLMLVCEQMDERFKLRSQVWQSNRSDERAALRRLEQQIVQNLSLLGFSPADRSRLGIAEVRRVSKLEELKARVQNKTN